MDTAAGLVTRLVRDSARRGPALVIATIAVVALTAVAIAAVAGHLQPAPADVLMAPFRWWAG